MKMIASQWTQRRFGRYGSMTARSEWLRALLARAFPRLSARHRLGPLSLWFRRRSPLKQGLRKASSVVASSRGIATQHVRSFRELRFIERYHTKHRTSRASEKHFFSSRERLSARHLVLRSVSSAARRLNDPREKAQVSAIALSTHFYSLPPARAVFSFRGTHSVRETRQMLAFTTRRGTSVFGRQNRDQVLRRLVSETGIVRVFAEQRAPRAGSALPTSVSAVVSLSVFDRAVSPASGANHAILPRVRSSEGTRSELTLWFRKKEAEAALRAKSKGSNARDEHASGRGTSRPTAAAPELSKTKPAGSIVSTLSSAQLDHLTSEIIARMRLRERIERERRGR